jgi:uncharacterized protein (TIGR01777 family)
MVVAVTGSSGLIGSALVKVLEAEGQFVRRVVRRPARDTEHELFWDPVAEKIDAAQFRDIDAVVHLAGEGIVAHRWNDAFKAKIRDSRVQGTRLLSETLASLSKKPTVLVSASAIGYYGDRGGEWVDESSPPGRGFLSEVCQEWESATQPARDAGIRVVNLRIGVVLSTKGGALAQMLTPFRLGLGGVIGSGRQYISWIALDDLVRAIQFSLHTEAIRGPVNAVAPEPATNHEFTKTLGRLLHRPTLLAMPATAARLAFGEMADEMLLTGARVKPQVLITAGFRFDYPQLEPALRHVLSQE